jgi:hypothetical protein
MADQACGEQPKKKEGILTTWQSFGRSNLPDTLKEARTHPQLIYKNSWKDPAAADPSRTEETAGKAVTLPSHHCSAKLVALRSRIVHDKVAILSVY